MATMQQTRTPPVDDAPRETALVILGCAISELISSERTERFPGAGRKPVGWKPAGWTPTTRRETSTREWRLSGRHWAGPVRTLTGRRVAGWRAR